MKILLLGDYSGVHYNLRNALRNNGDEVLLISNGDGYKSIGLDIPIKYNHLSHNNKYIDKILKLYYLLLAFSGFKGVFQIIKYLKVIRNMKGYDVVQLINPLFLTDYGSIVNLITFLYLRNNNEKIFLSALGDDYYWVKYCLNQNFEYSIFDRLNLRTLKNYSHSLQYVYGFLNPFLNRYIVKNSRAVIPGLYDYYAAYKDMHKCTEIVPIIIPVVDRKPIKHSTQFPIKIFHGWQQGREITKGNDIFDIALQKLKKNYEHRIEYKIVSGLPYDEYIKSFDDSQIFIDQCYSQDCGVNALLGMKDGKVVFGGFERDVKNYYKVKDDPMINSIPDANQIYEDLESLVLNPLEIQQYSLRAISFIKEFHSENYVLNKYQKIWNDY